MIIIKTVLYYKHKHKSIRLIQMLTRLFTRRCLPTASLTRNLQMGFSQHNDNGHSKDNKYGVQFDEEQIKRKIEELKDREAGNQSTNKNQQKNSKEFMKNYQVVKEKPKVLKFRQDTQTEFLMNFEDLSLDDKPTTLQVTSYSKEEIEVDGFRYPPSVILTPNQVLLWEIETQDKILPASLKLIQMLNPPPTYVIIGCDNPLKVRSQVEEYLSGFGINYDIIGMFEAISNFNNFAVDEVNLIAFLHCEE